jgi:purine/pyrimidine-nucleoside phosphorylase
MLTTNEYFDGKVKSIAFNSIDLPATVGVMEAGEYTFNTSQREYMTVVSGKLSVLLPNMEEWKDFTDSQTFVVEANQSFDLKVESDTVYLCKYE